MVAFINPHSKTRLQRFCKLLTVHHCIWHLIVRMCMTEIPATVASNEFQLFGIYMKESASSCELILIYTQHSHPSLILCSLDLLDFKQRHMHKVDVSKATRHPSTLQLSSITDFFEQLKTRGAFSNLCKDVRHARNKNSQQQ